VALGAAALHRGPVRRHCSCLRNLTVSEYGQPILPTWLGVVGLLPCLAGLVAVVLLWRRSTGPPLRPRRANGRHAAGAVMKARHTNLQ
jgi:hypothetical protein